MLAQTNEFAYSAGGGGREFGVSVAVSNSGNSYITGFYNSDSISFSNGNTIYPFNTVNTNVFFSKTDTREIDRRPKFTVA